MKTSFGSLSRSLAMGNKPLPLHPAQLRFEPSFVSAVGRLQRLIDEIQRLVSLVGAFARLRQQTEVVRSVIPRPCRRPVGPPFSSEREPRSCVATACQHVAAHDVGGSQPKRKLMLDGER